jgi:hypothetical protein
MNRRCSKRLIGISVCGCLVLALSAAAQTPAPKPPQPKPDFKVGIDGLIVADFSARIEAYAALRRTLEEGLPGLQVTDDVSEIRRAETALAIRIRAARAGARQGNIFTPAISTAFRQLFPTFMTPGICAAIVNEDDDPKTGDIEYRTGRSYPRGQPLSTVPPSVLEALPRLPEDVQYRFIKRDLILYDTRANMMLDRIKNAIRCSPR